MMIASDAGNIISVEDATQVWNLELVNEEKPYWVKRFLSSCEERLNVKQNDDVELKVLRRWGFYFSVFAFSLLIWIPPLVMVFLRCREELSGNQRAYICLMFL